MDGSVLSPFELKLDVVGKKTNDYKVWRWGLKLGRSKVWFWEMMFSGLQEFSGRSSPDTIAHRRQVPQGGRVLAQAGPTTKTHKPPFYPIQASSQCFTCKQTKASPGLSMPRMGRDCGQTARYGTKGAHTILETKTGPIIVDTNINPLQFCGIDNVPYTSTKSIPTTNNIVVQAGTKAR